MNAPTENHMIRGNADACPEMSDREQAAMLRRVDQLATKKLNSAEWWDSQLEAINATTGALPQAMARVMTNLNRACLGDDIARNAVLSAMSILQRAAMTEAMEQALTEETE